MNSKQSEFDTFLENVLAEVPVVRPLSEVRARYRTQIEDACRRHLARFQAETADSKAAYPDVIVSLQKFLQKSADAIRELADSAFGGDMVATPCYATRGLGGSASDQSRQSLSQEPKNTIIKQGGAFPIRLELNSAVKDSIDISIYPVAASGKPLLPFRLTAVDQENGQKLIDGEEYRDGPTVIRGVAPGNYRFIFEVGSESGTFDFRVEG